MRATTRRLAMTIMAGLALGLAAGRPAEADIIVSVQGDNNGGYTVGALSGGYSQVVALSWTQSQSYSNVSISVPLLENGSTTDVINAYLVRGTVPQPATNQVAATSFSTSPLTTRSYSIFSGLNLAAGTYSLVLSSLTASQVGWQYSSSPTITQAPGVILPNQAYTSFDTVRPAYSPNDPNFKPTNNGVYLNIAVTGTPAAVPEPASLAMVGIGLAGIGLVARKRRLA